MNKNVIMLMLLFFINSSIYAQIAQHDGIVFVGLHSSLQSTKFKVSEDFSDPFLRDFERAENKLVDYQNIRQFGYSFGLTAGINASSKVGVLLNATYNNNGYDYEIDELTDYLNTGSLGIYSTEERHNSISVNTLVRVQPIDTYSSFYLLLGPSFYVGIGGSKKTYFNPGTEKSVLLGEIEELSFGNDRFSNYKAVVPGFIFGIGYSFYINDTTRFTAELQQQQYANLYSEERLDYLKEIDSSIVGKKKLRATSLRVGIEYIFSMDK